MRRRDAPRGGRVCRASASETPVLREQGLSSAWQLAGPRPPLQTAHRTIEPAGVCRSPEGVIPARLSRFTKENRENRGCAQWGEGPRSAPRIGGAQLYQRRVRAVSVRRPHCCNEHLHVYAYANVRHRRSRVAADLRGSRRTADRCERHSARRDPLLCELLGQERRIGQQATTAWGTWTPATISTTSSERCPPSSRRHSTAFTPRGRPAGSSWGRIAA